MITLHLQTNLLLRGKTISVENYVSSRQPFFYPEDDMSKMFSFLLFQPFLTSFCSLVDCFVTVMYFLVVCYKTISICFMWF